MSENASERVNDGPFLPSVSLTAARRMEDDEQNGKGKGKKGKGKGKNDANKPSYLPGTKLKLVTHSPDGKQICYRFNVRGKKCDGRCNRMHICRVENCNAAHPAYEHPVTSN